MVNWSDIQFSYGNKDYIYRLEQLRIRSESLAVEIENARQGKSNLLQALQDLVVFRSGLSASFSANGFAITDSPGPVNPGDLVNKAYADNLSFSAALPAQAGNAGLEITTDGNAASWGITAPGAIAILNFIGYQGF